MDHATLTDNHGREADFRHVIADHDHERRRAGAGERARSASPAAARATASTEVERLFSPEFRNRLDEIVTLRGARRPR